MKSMLSVLMSMMVLSAGAAEVLLSEGTIAENSSIGLAGVEYKVTYDGATGIITFKGKGSTSAASCNVIFHGIDVLDDAGKGVLGYNGNCGHTPGPTDVLMTDVGGGWLGFSIKAADYSPSLGVFLTVALRQDDARNLERFFGINSMTKPNDWAGFDGSWDNRIKIIMPRLVILSLSPDTEVLLGDDLTITYQIIASTGFAFDTVDLEVRNSVDAMVFKTPGLGTGVGPHTIIWDHAKWNQSPHSGAYANPNSGNYKLKVVAKKGWYVSYDEKSIKTKLVIESDITDEKAGTASRSAGLADLADALDVVVTKGTTVHTFAGTALTLTDIADGKNLKVDNSTLNSLVDGTWTFQLKDVRDEIGNFYGSNPAAGTIDHYKWDMDLY
jgi:hypothetical protein